MNYSKQSAKCSDNWRQGGVYCLQNASRLLKYEALLQENSEKSKTNKQHTNHASA